jgi:hypothetical protein
MLPPLTPREQAALRLLEKQIRREDPALAERLRRHGSTAVKRSSPMNWSASVYVTIGLIFLATGIAFGVGSAVLGGLLALGIATARSQKARQVIVSMLTKVDGRPKQ